MLALLFLVCRLASAADRNTHAKPDWGMYTSRSRTMEEVRAIVERNPSFMRMRVVTATEGGYQVGVPLVVVEPGGLAKGPDDARMREKLRVFYNFGEHGREIITTELALRVLETLESVDKLNDAMKGHPRFSDVLAQYYRTVFYIVPIENSGGRDQVENGSLCERKNGRGVDTNRNWEVDFGVKEPDYDPSEEFPGTFPYSEPETFVLRQELVAFQPHVWVNVHSGMEALFMPYDHRQEIPSGAEAHELYRTLVQLNAWHCRGKCAVGSGGKEVGYKAHGTGTDTIYMQLNVPMVMTWEVYGVTTAHYDDCFRMFNPTDRTTFDDVVARWSAAFFGLLPLANEHAGVRRRMALARDAKSVAEAQNQGVLPRADFFDTASRSVSVKRSVEPKLGAKLLAQAAASAKPQLYTLRGGAPTPVHLPAYQGVHVQHNTFRNMPPGRAADAARRRLPTTRTTGSSVEGGARRPYYSENLRLVLAERGGDGCLAGARYGVCLAARRVRVVVEDVSPGRVYVRGGIVRQAVRFGRHLVHEGGGNRTHASVVRQQRAHAHVERACLCEARFRGRHPRLEGCDIAREGVERSLQRDEELLLALAGPPRRLAVALHAALLALVERSALAVEEVVVVLRGSVTGWRRLVRVDVHVDVDVGLGGGVVVVRLRLQ